MTRAEATLDTQLARSAVGVAATELARLGLISILPAATRSGVAGRPSPHLELKPEGAHVIAVDVRADTIELAAIDLAGSILHQERCQMAVREYPPREALLDIADAIKKTIAQTAYLSPLCGIGLAIPGIMTQDSAIARTVLSLNWHNVPIKSVIEERLGQQVAITVGHDATLGALAEYLRGAGRGAKRLLYLTSQPNGVGSAMISRQTRLYSRGDHTLQAGHLNVNPLGAECACGSRGCLEIYVNGRAISRSLSMRKAGSPDKIRQHLLTLDPGDLDKFLASDCIGALRIGLVSLINTLAPDRVVLAGALAPIGELMPSLLREVLAMSVVAGVEPVDLVPAALDQDVLIGAAEQAFESLKLDPARVLDARISLATSSDLRRDRER
ncbi:MULTISPECIES: ROK family protein [unclassified Chelatococcus]|uniref:ROK family protein n=1 Tax=unclassified Chelatococcus TaxID=2638111 RepID=UPI001BCDAE36|nr:MULTISPECIES: ROK family protein [unclassified Chelatococcus]CAH1655869.1 ROK family protein [Hyphomicrobiales bacterium]MBS7742543.1 ROK family protein [Chelatococcus sp. HY11]MBX3542339.1 ROK family protein [Chelatococcus sp.]MCO5075443.1 ROK family protein [Chelatococcus sp.]CAH1695663.1 ROK family protein [Hyphomicrobiales bacterium]